MAQKLSMTRDDLFDTNAEIVSDLTKEISRTCPNAFILVITNPVNSITPLIAEIMKSENKFNPRKLFGITTLDIVRAATFASQVTDIPPENITVPVVGGHSRDTIVPLFSQSTPALNLSREELQDLIQKVQCGGDEVQKAKAGAGTATLCMGYAAYKFIDALLRACNNGEKGIVQASYMYLAEIPGGDSLREQLGGLDYFSANVELGLNGAEKVLPLGEITDLEKEVLGVAITEIEKNISKGISFSKPLFSKKYD